MVMENMIETVENKPEICVLESDNCASQYKSAEHFEDIQHTSQGGGVGTKIQDIMRFSDVVVRTIFRKKF